MEKIAKSKWTGFVYAAAALYLAFMIWAAKPAPGDESVFALIGAFLLVNVFVVSLIMAIKRIRADWLGSQDVAPLEDEIAIQRTRRRRSS